MRACSSARVAGAVRAFVDAARFGAGCAEIDCGSAAPSEAINSATQKRPQQKFRFRFVSFISVELLVVALFSISSAVLCEILCVPVVTNVGRLNRRGHRGFRRERREKLKLGHHRMTELFL